MTSKKSPATDPAAKPKRRLFTVEYKLRMVAEYDAAPAGEKSTALRCERLGAPARRGRRKRGGNQ
jgi:hypothetical protein